MGAKPPTLGYAGRQLWVGREESTDTPDSVPAHSCPCVGDGHPSRPAVADWLKRPTRVLRRAAVERTHIRTCSRWGLPSRPGHPGRWWSLTPPFHPDRLRRMPRPAVFSLWHCPAGRPGWPLATTVPFGVRTFLGRSPLATERDRLVDSSRLKSIVPGSRPARPPRIGPRRCRWTPPPVGPEPDRRDRSAHGWRFARRRPRR